MNTMNFDQLLKTWRKFRPSNLPCAWDGICTLYTTLAWSSGLVFERTGRIGEMNGLSLFWIRPRLCSSIICFTT